jgi:hypothetical protein
MTQPTTVYVAMRGQYPIGVSGHLADAQAAALAQESKYDREPREYRWDETYQGQTWQLMVRNEHTRRWGKCLVSVHAAPVVDTPAG